MGSYHYVGLVVLLAKGRHAVLEATTECAEDLVRAAQERTPVATGTLKASIHVASVTQSGMHVEAIVSTGGEADEYAAYVEAGTYKMDGFKFMEGGLQEVAPVFEAAMAKACSRAF